MRGGMIARCVQGARTTMQNLMKSAVRLAAGTGIAMTLATPAHADEGGVSVYILGLNSPGSAVQPPLPGIYIDNSIYIYNGSAGAERDLVIGGRVVADLDATLAANFTTALWVPTTNFLGGTLSIGGTLPVGAVMVDAAAVLTGPLGRQIDVRRHDSALVVGDPLGLVNLGWKSGKTHFAIMTTTNIPVGNYREGQLANVAFHRWQVDISGAVSWVDEESGWDLTAKAGYTIDGRNDVTDYRSGDDIHIEASVSKSFSKAFNAGILGGYFEQVTDDSGSGARLGGFRGRVAVAGGTIGYNTILGRAPAAFRLKALKEFAVRNRTEGWSVFGSLTLPLTMKMPPH